MNIDTTIKMLEVQLQLMNDAMVAKTAKAVATQQMVVAELGLMQLQCEQVSGTLAQLRAAKDAGVGSPIIPPSALGFKQ